MTTIDLLLSKSTLVELKQMLTAAEEIVACVRGLKKDNSSILSTVLEGQTNLETFKYFPADGVYDPHTGSQYYFHSHGPQGQEIGHFHTFVYEAHFPTPSQPIYEMKSGQANNAERRFSHLVAFAVNNTSQVVRLFTTNQWVTSETVFKDETVGELAKNFCVSLERGDSIPEVSRWINATMQFYQPQVQWLIRQRESVFSEWQKNYPSKLAFEDRELNELTSLAVDFKKQRNEIRRLLKTLE